MANNLPIEKQVMAISALVEGASIRSVERMTGIHRDTIMRLSVRVGEACLKMMEDSMKNLPCNEIQVDEIWGFIGKKKRNITANDSGVFVGDVWTYVAIDPETKLIPCFVAGKRDLQHTRLFLEDLASRMKNRIQLSSDSLDKYLPAVEAVFGANVDYGQIVKTYASPHTAESAPSRRYSPGEVVSVKRTAMMGSPEQKRISTSIVESQNLTLRMHCRRLTRLTNAFSKKIENFRAAVALHFAYYNFVKIHTTLRTTPAMAAGISCSLWSVTDLVQLAD